MRYPCDREYQFFGFFFFFEPILSPVRRATEEGRAGEESKPVRHRFLTQMNQTSLVPSSTRS